MQWVVDKVSDQSLLNTAGWKFIIPRLYWSYPNDDMVLNISMASSPIMWITSENIGATINADMIIDVLHGTETVPVACISVVRKPQILDFTYDVLLLLHCSKNGNKKS
jgi:lipopolysaccharide-binding protein